MTLAYLLAGWIVVAVVVALALGRILAYCSRGDRDAR